MAAVRAAARSGRVGGFQDRLLFFRPQGQIMESEVTSRSSSAASMACQSLSMDFALK